MPFLVLALLALFQQLSRRGPLARTIRLGGAVELPLSALLLGVFTAACLLLFALYFPVISGAPTTQAYADALVAMASRNPNMRILAISHDPTMKARFVQNIVVTGGEDGSTVTME